jgi:hypothetical protein
MIEGDSPRTRSSRLHRHPRPRNWLALVAAMAGPWLLGSAVMTQEAVAPVRPVLTPAQQETFLLEARIIRTRTAAKGITGSLRATLTDGVLTHDAHVQTIDVARHEFEGTRGRELNFRDTWRYNVAAYRLSVLLGLDMVPVTVERRYQQQPASFTWWVDDVAMDEATRLRKKIRAPDTTAWNQQMYLVRVFDQLIYNTDRNLGNLLITSDWRLWMIDHTRAFRRFPTVRSAKSLTRCDRTVLARLEALDKPTLERELSRWLEPYELDPLLSRRDAIVAHFRSAPPDVLFDLPQRTPPVP